MELELINKVDFDKLSNAEKRVAICKDVLARIAASKIRPNSGSFWKYGPTDFDSYGDSMQKRVNDGECAVCAKGALFCSWVGNFNEVKIDAFELVADELPDTDEMVRVVPELVEIFGQQMLDNIEAVFEKETYYWSEDQHENQNYIDAFDDFTLEDIMKYIIANGGDFPLR